MVRGLSPTAYSASRDSALASIFPSESESGLATQTKSPSEVTWMGEVCSCAASALGRANASMAPPSTLKIVVSRRSDIDFPPSIKR